MNAVEWITLNSGVSSVGGKMKVLKFLHLVGGHRNQCDHFGKHSTVHTVPAISKWTYDLLPNSSLPEYSASKNGSLYPQEFFLMFLILCIVDKIRNYSNFLQQESRYVTIHSSNGITF